MANDKSIQGTPKKPKHELCAGEVLQNHLSLADISGVFYFGDRTMKHLLLITILTVILCICGCAPNSVGVGAIFIDINSRAGDIRGVAPIVMAEWDITK